MNERLIIPPSPEEKPAELAEPLDAETQAVIPEESSHDFSEATAEHAEAPVETEQPAGPSEAELQRREGTAVVAGEILTGIIEGPGGFFGQSSDPFDQAMKAVLQTGAARVQEGLRSSDPEKRAKATNFMRSVNKDAANRTLAEAGEPIPEVTPEQELNDYAFAPSEVKSLVAGLEDEPDETEQVGNEKLMDDVKTGEASQVETEQLTLEEKMIAREVSRYTDAVAEKAEESGLLVRGDHVFGSQTEAAFGDYFSSVEDGGFGELSEEDRRKAVADAFAKFRDRAYRHLQLGKRKPHAKKAAKSDSGLAA